MTGNGTIFATSGKNGPVVAVEPVRSEAGWAARLKWRVESGGPYVCSPLLYGGRLYVHNEIGVLSCYRADDGKLVYRRRLPGKFTASAAAGDGKAYLTNEEGTTYVVRAGDEYELLAVNRLEEYALASPAISGGRLFLRAGQHLYCIAPGTERPR